MYRERVTSHVASAVVYSVKKKKKKITIEYTDTKKIKKERKREYYSIVNKQNKIVHCIKILLNSSNRLVFELISITRQTKASW